MAKYLIKVSQPAKVAARQIAESVRTIGSHFATHASWQQKDGVATGCLVVEVDDRKWALCVVPPAMRAFAEIVRIDAPTREVGSTPAIVDSAQIPYPLAA
jgi:hypothetical protein